MAVSETVPGGPVATAGRGGFGRVLGSRGALWLFVALFTVQSAWVAVAARYSIYDEQGYHLAAIEDFARRWTPYFRQDAGDAGVGDITRYGSFLYHYLMSFPWRATAWLGDLDRLVLMRLITVAMVAAGLLVWAAVFRALGASRAVTNTGVLLLAANPLLVFLAGSLNYDNMLFLVLALFALYAVRLHQADGIDVRLWLAVLLVGGLALITKYTALAFVVPVVVVLVVRQVWLVRRQGASVRGVPASLASRAAVPWWLLVVVTVGVLAVVAERYVGNVVRYGTPLPDCGAVQPTQVCATWGPWARDQQADAQYPDQPLTVHGAVAFAAQQWIPLMLRYATLVGVGKADGTAQANIGPHVLGVLVVVSVIAGLAVLALAAPRLARRSALLTLGVGVVAYLASLFVANYGTFAREGAPLGIQGRYALVVLPPVVVAVCLGVSELVGAHRRWKTTLWWVTAVLLTQGGGVLTFAYVADGSWLWDARPVAQVESWLHDTARRVVLPDDVVPDPRS